MTATATAGSGAAQGAGLIQGASVQLISFSLGQQHYCVDIMSVREIRAWTGTTFLPKTADFVRGVINLRGTIVPIIDLRTRFRQGTTEPTKTHVVIILAIGERLNGILVDSVSDVLTVRQDEIQPLPQGRAEAKNPFIDGLVTQDGRMIALLSLERLFDHAVRTRMAADDRAPAEVAPHTRPVQPDCAAGDDRPEIAGEEQGLATDLGLTPSHVFGLWHNVNAALLDAAKATAQDPALLRSLEQMNPGTFAGKVPADVLERVIAFRLKLNQLRARSGLKPVSGVERTSREVTPSDVFLGSSLVLDGVVEWLIERSGSEPTASRFYRRHQVSGMTPSDVFGLVDLAERRLERVLDH